LDDPIFLQLKVALREIKNGPALSIPHNGIDHHRSGASAERRLRALPSVERSARDQHPQ
jgi:hypothetical protein